MRERKADVIVEVARARGIDRLVRRVDLWRAAAARRVKAVLRPGQPRAGQPVYRNDRVAMIEHAVCTHAQTRVLLCAADRRFRALASTLLSQRGCLVSVPEGGDDVCAQAERDGADVVLLDATGRLTAAAETAARLRSLRPEVGLVAVSSDPRDRLAALPVVPKWGSPDVLFMAIERARARRGDG